MFIDAIYFFSSIRYVCPSCGVCASEEGHPECECDVNRNILSQGFSQSLLSHASQPDSQLSLEETTVPPVAGNYICYSLPLNVTIWIL